VVCVLLESLAKPASLSSAVVQTFYQYPKRLGAPPYTFGKASDLKHTVFNGANSKLAYIK
jgi:hypothetical protein